MKWTDTFWTAYSVVVNTTIDTVTSTLNTVGSLVCMAGGVAFSLSYAINETLNASYYGSANTSGHVNFGIHIDEFNYSINGSIPFNRNLEKDGGITYQLTDYITPDTLRLTSGILTSSGMLLNLIGDNLKHWQQGRRDEAFYQKRGAAGTLKPPLKEYLWVGAASLSRSFSYTLLSCAFTSTVLNNSGIVGTVKQITYPFTSSKNINSTHYDGPVQATSIPVEFTLNQNATVELPIIHVSVAVEEKVDAIATVDTVYGGGLFLHSHDRPNFPTPLPAAAGISAFLASTFFAKKLIQKRDERIIEAQEKGYLIIQ